MVIGEGPATAGLLLCGLIWQIVEKVLVLELHFKGRQGAEKGNWKVTE